MTETGQPSPPDEKGAPIVELTIVQAAARTGKSARQVRYLIRTGSVRARKVNGCWMIDARDLSDSLADSPAESAGKRAAGERKQRQLRGAVERGLELPEKPRVRGSVRDLKAFALGVPLHERARAALGDAHPATRALHTMLEHLARGYHRYDYADKAHAYRDARDAASAAVCELMLTRGDASEDGGEPAADIAREIEGNVMFALAGVLRRLDRKRVQ